MKLEVIRTDVLVVGSGGAGARAAIEASDAGARVMMAVKGVFGESGATAYPVADRAGLSVANGWADPGDNPEAYYRDILAASRGTCSPDLARILAEESISVVPDLERFGVQFERNARGEYVMTQGCFSSRPRSVKTVGHARPIVQALREQVRCRPIDVREHMMAVDLVAPTGRCKGALLMDELGNSSVVHAKAVILATGGAGQLFSRNLNPPDVTGDGYAMAYRAGAALVNMEFMQYGFSTAYPNWNLFGYMYWPLRPRLTNGRGEEFMGQYIPSGLTLDGCMAQHSRHYPFTTEDTSRYLEMGVQKEITAGRGTSHDAVYADLTHVGSRSPFAPDHPVSKLWPRTRQYLIERGLDVDNKPVEIAPFAHAFNGGLLIDENGESSIPGLFAVGEVASGMHGADRLGGAMLVACQVFGRRAGVRAASVPGARLSGADQDVARESAAFVSKLSDTHGTVEPGSVKKELQDAASKDLFLVRSARSLETFLGKVEGLESRSVSKVQASLGTHLWAALEVRNLLLVGRIVAEAALMRKETRGSHCREDFPEKVPELEKMLTIRRDAVR